MSGGTWEYIQYRFQDIGDDLDRLIAENDSEELNEWGDQVGRHYSPATIEKLKLTAHRVRETAIMLQRADYLLAADDSEESFHERWNKELEKLNEQEQQTETRSEEKEKGSGTGFEGYFDEGCDGCTPRRQRRILSGRCHQGPCETDASAGGCADSSAD